MIRDTLLCGRALSEQALWLLLNEAKICVTVDTWKSCRLGVSTKVLIVKLVLEVVVVCLVAH